MINPLFRGLSTKGVWVYGSLVLATKHDRSPTKSWIVESAYGNGGWFSVGRRQYVLPHTVGQFTGKCDYLGHKIFTDDVVRVNGRTEHYVIYSEQSAMYKLLGDLGLYRYDSSQLEVVGNHHE